LPPTPLAPLMLLLPPMPLAPLMLSKPSAPPTRMARHCYEE
jgi:hypothetical protein